MTLPVPVNPTQAMGGGVISFGSKSTTDAVDQEARHPQGGAQQRSHISQPVQVALVRETGQHEASQPHDHNVNGTDFRLITTQELGRITTKLTSDTEFSGVYTSKLSNAGLLVAGLIAGEVTLAEGSVFHLERTGRADMCTVRADAVLIAGGFSGTIYAKKLEIAVGAVVDGAIHYEEIAIHPGAKVKADHHMPE